MSKSKKILSRLSNFCLNKRLLWQVSRESQKTSNHDLGLNMQAFCSWHPIDGIPVIATKPDESSRVRSLGKIEEEFVPMEGGVTLKGKLQGGGGPLFPDTLSETIQSTAIVPLESHKKKIGFLILGSKDPARYQRGDGNAPSQTSRYALSLGNLHLPEPQPGNSSSGFLNLRKSTCHRSFPPDRIIKRERLPHWQQVPSPRRCRLYFPNPSPAR